MMWTKRLVAAGVVAALAVVGAGAEAHAIDDRSTRVIAKRETLYADAYRQGGEGTISGNTRKWGYQVAAKVVTVKGKTPLKIAEIRASWQASVSLRNSASFTLTVAKDGVTASSSSSWQSKTDTAYWSNTSGVRTASYKGTMVAAPKGDYRTGTIALSNTARVKFKGDATPYDTTASV